MHLDPIQLAHRVNVTLRERLEKVHMLAVMRCRYEAHALGLTLSLERGGRVAVVSDGTHEIWADARRSLLIWEVVRYFDYFVDLVRMPIINGKPVLDVSQPGEHVLARSGRSFRFTVTPESEATNELYLDVAKLQPGHVAIDGGAYCGCSSIAFAEAVGPTGRVLALEPDPDNFAALLENVERYGVGRQVTALREGLWVEGGSVKFIVGKGMLSSIVQPNQVTYEQTRSIDVKTLEQIVNEHRLERLDFLKLDIEGSELRVLESSRKVLREFRPRIVVEAVQEDRVLNTPRMLKLLKEEGYHSRVFMETWNGDYQVVCAVPADVRTTAAWPANLSARQ